ncbi:hypothetical protein Q8F55_004831 [Vanrija albida]|uniref:RRM domain-containing protein n=1 Tax=Vanrija albida TaxID=181172 RepID=A0ABR3PZX2_9TREE
MAEVAPPSAGPSRAADAPAPAPPAENGTNGVHAPADANDDDDDDELGPDGLPKNASETLYLHNLNEKVRIPVLTQTLTSLFKPYRPLQPVVAHRNARMRGQAFISFADKATADLARRDVNEFPLYGKPLIIAFARTQSDVVHKRLEGEEGLEEWKKVRLADKKLKRKDNPFRRKQIAKHKAGTDDNAGPSAAKKPRLQMPDEYLPPNNVLFIQNLPDGTTQEDLREVFEQYPGLVQIRTIAAKKDIAFVEFEGEQTATVAKDALHNFKIDGETKMKVTYARK